MNTRREELLKTKPSKIKHLKIVPLGIVLLGIVPPGTVLLGISVLKILKIDIDSKNLLYLEIEFKDFHSHILTIMFPYSLDLLSLMLRKLMIVSGLMETVQHRTRYSQYKSQPRSQCS